MQNPRCDAECRLPPEPCTRSSLYAAHAHTAALTGTSYSLPPCPGWCGGVCALQAYPSRCSTRRRLATGARLAASSAVSSHRRRRSSRRVSYGGAACKMPHWSCLRNRNDARLLRVRHTVVAGCSLLIASGGASSALSCCRHVHAHNCWGWGPAMWNPTLQLYICRRDGRLQSPMLP